MHFNLQLIFLLIISIFAGILRSQDTHPHGGEQECLPLKHPQFKRLDVHNVDNMPITTHPDQIDPPPRPPPTTPQEREELRLRQLVLRGLGRFPSTFGHLLGQLNDSCDPVLHEEYMKTPKITDFYKDGAWHDKICMWMRFLHCDNATSTCICAPESVYGVAFEKSDLTGDYENIPCVPSEHHLCFKYLRNGSWPAVDHDIVLNFPCGPADSDGNTYSCRFYEDIATKQVSERCSKCVKPGPTNSTATPTVFNYRNYIFPLIVSVLNTF